MRALTSWRPQREGLVREWKEIDHARGNSLSGDHRGGDQSGHGKKVTKQGALTSWRLQREGLVSPQNESN